MRQSAKCAKHGSVASEAWSSVYGACRTKEASAFVCRANEACFLLRVLIENSLPRLTQLLEEPWRGRLQSMSLKDLICSKEGENTVAQLMSVLINQYQQSSGML